MEIVHVSAECFPVAKVGGLADVVGALPKYQQSSGHIAKVVMPMYRTKFLYDNEWELVHEGGAYMGNNSSHYSVIKEKTNRLGFDLYLIDVNGLLDRERVYGYHDDTERFLSFQIAFCDWLSHWQHRPDIIHVHDHHTALIPFMLSNCYAYNHLGGIPTLLTIHNAQYQGWFGWDKRHLLPPFDNWKAGLLDWSNTINPLACGIKCAWRVTTVSNSYMHELFEAANGLESLLRHEKAKCTGILNGIDDEVWDPQTDAHLFLNYSTKTIAKGKTENRKRLCEAFGLNPDKPLFVFIGRLVGEKAADLLPQAITDAFTHIGRDMSILVLGSGEPAVEEQLLALKERFPVDYNLFIGYNETLSHQMYAGADFLLMPSRVEPCGLNQMYAMRYGTVPIVSSTGGLKDTVVDISEPDGYGVRFDYPTIGELTHAIYRALDLYKRSDELDKVRKTIMTLNFSWNRSAAEYLEVYSSLVH
mgnify:CR=1 FL=1